MHDIKAIIRPDRLERVIHAPVGYLLTGYFIAS